MTQLIENQLKTAVMMGVDFGSSPSVSLLMHIDDGRLTYVNVVQNDKGKLFAFPPAPMGKRLRRRLKAKGLLYDQNNHGRTNG